MSHTFANYTVSIMVFVLGSACSVPEVQQTWSGPGLTKEHFEQDRAICLQDRGFAGLRGDADFETCMKAKGWFLINEPAN